jgi:hypothetical protein
MCIITAICVDHDTIDYEQYGYYPKRLFAEERHAANNNSLDFVIISLYLLPVLQLIFSPQL